MTDAPIASPLDPRPCGLGCGRLVRVQAGAEGTHCWVNADDAHEHVCARLDPQDAALIADLRRLSTHFYRRGRTGGSAIIDRAIARLRSPSAVERSRRSEAAMTEAQREHLTGALRLLVQKIEHATRARLELERIERERAIGIGYPGQIERQERALSHSEFVLEASVEQFVDVLEQSISTTEAHST